MIISAVGETEPAMGALNGLPVAGIRGQLDRVLHSRVFLHSHRIRKFLEFVVEESLAGQHHRLKEYLIGIEVFNRMETFDPRVDSIVRVEARRLRAKLDHYYRTEGTKDEIRIEMRKGSYAPYFAPRRDSQEDSFPYQPSTRRRSIALAPFTVDPAASSNAPLLDRIRRRITHVLVSEGFSQVLHCQDSGAGQARVDFVIHCNVEFDDRVMRVMLQLLGATDGAHLWSGEICAANDSAALSDASPIDEITRSLNRALVMFRSLTESGRSQRHRSHSPGLDNYIQGRYLWKSGSPEAICDSIEFFAAALREDSSYASAWAALAESLIVSSVFGLCDSQKVRPRIEEAARKARELNDDLSEAHLALGAVASLFEGNWQKGEKAFLRAIQLDGGDSRMYVAYGLQLACRGMINAALVQIERALELDPASLYANFVWGWLQGVAGNADIAITRHSLMARLAPDFALAPLGLGWAYGNKGMWAAAIEHFERAASLMSSPALLAGCLGSAQAQLGNRREALRQLDFLKILEGGSRPDVSIAAVHACLGETGRAIDFLEKAAISHDCGLPLQLLNPEFRMLKGESRFTSLLARIGLKPLVSPEYITAPAKLMGPQSAVQPPTQHSVSVL